MSFVYYWLRENGTPYYVGYGKHKTRAYAKHPRKNGEVPKPSTDRIHIHEYHSDETAKLREWEMINFLKPMLLNICPGYNTSHAFYGEDNPFYGKHHSEETKQKISQSKLGKKIHSNEFKVKQAERQKQRKGTWNHTEEVKLKCAAGGKANKGRKQTEDEKRKKSESAKKRWEKYREMKSENRKEGDV